MSKTYHARFYPLIQTMEKEHFWYRARSSLLQHLIQRYIPHGKGKTFLEIGCGTGILLPVFESLGLSVTGMDINSQALSYAKGKSHAHLIRSSFLSFKQKKQYDSIGIFDILEHQNDDLKFLTKCYSLLRSGGYLFISVPAHQWLWNGIDIMSGHKRRYEKSDLVEKLGKAGFSVCFSNYWNVLLLGFYVLWRLQFYFSKKSIDICQYLMIPKEPINQFCRWVLHFEHLFFFSIPFPFGSSLIIVAKKTMTAV
ncbi:class I SAM-dependent methyltransferase [Patescibacteria group bacterium]|nr:class I SAM-dependent methyltransferase [Patescibacteria group bacterium]